MEVSNMPWDEAANLDGVGKCEDWNGAEDPWPPNDIKADMAEGPSSVHHDEVFTDHIPDDRSSLTSTGTSRSGAKKMMYPEVEPPFGAGNNLLTAVNGPYFALPAISTPASRILDQTTETTTMTTTASRRTPRQILQCCDEHLHSNELHIEDATSMPQTIDLSMIGRTDTTSESPDDNAVCYDERGETFDAEDSDLGDQYASKYELRPQAKLASKSFTSTWIDQDDTGNYDPSEEARQLRAKRCQVKLRRRVDSIFEPGSEAGSNESDGRTPREPVKLVVQLPFKTAPGRLALRSILNKPLAQREPKHDDFGTGYRLRSKAVGAAEPKQSRNAEHGLPEDLTGHPVARGYWGCLELGKDDCTLLEDEHTYPCYACLDSASECELIVPPTVKRACESCKRRRRTCSYTYTDNHDKSCLDCADDGFHCVAGPSKDFIRCRIRYNAPPVLRKAEPTKVYWTCQQCQEAERTCSFTRNGQSVPDCTACEMNGAICIPKQSDTKPQPAKQELARKAEERRKKRARRDDSDEEPAVKSAKLDMVQPIENRSSTRGEASSTGKHAPANEHGAQSREQDPSKTQQPSKGRTRKITTKFSHPILFNNTKTAANGICNFCDGSSFALLGLEPKEVEVIDWKDGHDLTEVGGGHADEGTPSTRMCIVCTMHRCNIITCRGHSLRKIPNADKLLKGAGTALTGLFHGVVQKKDRWCSLCPSLASYECETGTVDSLGRPCLGCGLLLCETCMVYLGVEDGDLGEMLEGTVDGPSDERPLGMRADFELLKADGLLMRYMLWLSEHDEA